MMKVMASLENSAGIAVTPDSYESNGDFPVSSELFILSELRNENF